MRHVFVLLTLASLNACGPGLFQFRPLTTADWLGVGAHLLRDRSIQLQVQGTVTAADDGSLIAGAGVTVEGTCREGCIGTLASTTTDDSGRYSLSFGTAGKCAEENFYLKASAEGLLLRDLWYFSDPHIRCTKEMQTIDFQLKRKSP